VNYRHLPRYQQRLDNLKARNFAWAEKVREQRRSYGDAWQRQRLQAAQKFASAPRQPAPVGRGTRSRASNPRDDDRAATPAVGARPLGRSPASRNSLTSPRFIPRPNASSGGGRSASRSSARPPSRQVRPPQTSRPTPQARPPRQSTPTPRASPPPVRHRGSAPRPAASSSRGNGGGGNAFQRLREAAGGSGGPRRRSPR